MNARRTEDNSAMHKLGTRVRQRALSGTEASTIGFVLVAYIGVFAGLGYWLDLYFKTSWIVAVGVLLGSAVGFREMFRIAKKVTTESIDQDEAAARSTRLQSRTSLGSSGQSAPSRRVSTPMSQVEEEAKNRPRIFSIPPPPTASFDQARAKLSTSSTHEPDSDEELIERLLQNEGEASPDNDASVDKSS